MTITHHTGHVLDIVRQLPDNSVDLVATSPPFLALRNYNDLPDQWGSEPTPAAFLAHLLELTTELRRVLAPHGSIAIELGDSFSGSGGPGGDYGDGGWRDGQPAFSGTGARARSDRSGWTVAWVRWLAGIIDAEGYIGVRRQTSGRTGAPSFQTVVRVSMMDRQVVDKCAEVTGVGSVSQDARGAYSWSASAQQARYVLAHIWPDLLIKKRQALAGIELQRRIDDTQSRGKYAELTPAEIAHREMIRDYVRALNNSRGEKRGTEPPCWSPPEPQPIRVPYYDNGPGWPGAKSLCGTPTLYAWSLAYGRNLLDPAQTVEPWLVRNVIVWARNNPPVGALGDKVRPAVSYITVATPSPRRWFDLDAVRGPGSPNTHARTPAGVRRQPKAGKAIDAARGGNWASLDEIDDTGNGAPPLDHWHDQPDGDLLWLINTQGSNLSHYAMWPPALAERLILAMCPAQVCRVCGEPRRRLTGEAIYVHDSGRVVEPSRKGVWEWGGVERGKTTKGGAPESGHYSVQRPTIGWSECPCADYRPGVVLDPFAGTGTTLAAADINGRDAIGIDLDPANAALHATRWAQCWRALRPDAGPSPVAPDGRRQLGLDL